MSDKQTDCVVGSYIKHNNATVSADNPIIDLLALAKRVLERCNITSIKNKLQPTHVHATNEICTPDNFSKISCGVAWHRDRNFATGSVCLLCGYNKPFCLCNIPYPGELTCDVCKYFTPDTIGDGAGIGHCDLGIIWTQSPNGRVPLYRYTDRYCKQFTKLMI